MFEVVHLQSRKVYTVYGVSESKEKLPWFLIYEEGIWKWRYSKDFEPKRGK